MPTGYKILSLYCWDVLSAHEAYTWDELAAAIRQAYKDITSVYVLPKLINWSESIHPYVNDAATTPGIFFVAVFNPSHGKCADGTILFFFLAGFQGFTDYRCFHVCKKAVTFEGVTKEVGVVECKPDAASPTWGDTTGEHGTPVFKYI